MWVIYGEDTADLVDVDLDNLGARGMHVWGGGNSQRLGTSVAGLGRFNQGAVDDFAIGAQGFYGVAGTSSQSGAAIVVYGEDTADPSDFAVPLWQEPSTRVMVPRWASPTASVAVSVPAGRWRASATSTATPDSAASWASGRTNSTYTVPGQSRPSRGAMRVRRGWSTARTARTPRTSTSRRPRPASAQAARALRVFGDSGFAWLGWEMEGNVDVNGDGALDLVVSSPESLRAGVVRTPVPSMCSTHGNFDTEAGDVDIRSFGGYRILDPDASSFPVAIAASDVSGDSVDDVLIGMPDQDRNGRTDSGSVYLVDGPDDLLRWTWIWLMPSRRGSPSSTASRRTTGPAPGWPSTRRAILWSQLPSAVTSTTSGWSPSRRPSTPPRPRRPSTRAVAPRPTPPRRSPFHADESATFQCSIDQGTPAFSDCGGRRSAPTPRSPPLAVGAYTFRVRAQDTSSNVGAADTVLFSVTTGDTSAPDTTVTSGGGLTKDRTPSFGFTSDDAGATFECSVDQGVASFGACSGPGKTHTPATGLADGTWTFRVRATDAASNTDATPATRAVTVDGVAPQTTITTRPAATVRLKQGKKKAKVTFWFTASEASTFACTMDGARVACTSPTSYKLLKGKHVFTVVATDRAGNKDASPATYTVKVKKAKKS